VGVLPVPQRRLEDRIQALLNQAVTTQDPKELDEVVRRLRAALHEHSTRLRKLAAANLIALPKVKGAPAVMENSVTDDVAAD